VPAIAASASFACRAARVYLCDKRAVDQDQVLSCPSRSGTDPPVTVHVRLAAGGLTRPGRRNGTPICPRGGGRMEPSGKDGRGGEVSLAVPGHDGMPVRSRPTTALAIWSSGGTGLRFVQGVGAGWRDAAMAGTHQRPSYRLAHKSLCTPSPPGTRAVIGLFSRPGKYSQIRPCC
jgi:hypothetical protein